MPSATPGTCKRVAASTTRSCSSARLLSKMTAAPTSSAPLAELSRVPDQYSVRCSSVDDSTAVPDDAGCPLRDRGRKTMRRRGGPGCPPALVRPYGERDVPIQHWIFRAAERKLCSPLAYVRGQRGGTDASIPLHDRVRVRSRADMICVVNN